MLLDASPLGTPERWRFAPCNNGDAISFASSKRGGGVMGYVTWNDLITVAMLIVAVITCFNSKKK